MVGSGRLLHVFLLFLPISALSARAESYDLVRRFAIGETWTFEETQTVSFSAPGLPGGTSTFTIKTRLTEEVTRIEESGEVELAVTLNSFEADDMTAGPMVLDYGPLVGKTMRVILNSKAVATAVHPPEDLSNEGMPVFSMMKQFYLYMFGEGDFPDKPVAIGESWNSERAFSMESPLGVIDQIDSLKSTLNKRLKFQGSSCLEIGFEGTFTGTFSEGADGTIDGDYSGTRLVEEDSGRSLKLEMQINQQWSRVTHQGDVIIDYRISYNRELSPDEDSIR